MDNNFLKSFDRLIGHEGGFQNDPKDRGNWTSGKVGVGVNKGTKFGISAMSYPNLDIKNLTTNDAKKIYYQDWWIRYGFNNYHPALSYQMMDAAINHGISNANKILQRALGVVDDGVIGPISKNSINSTDQSELVVKFLAERLRFFTNISTFNTYGKGWSRRVADNIDLAITDLRG